MQNNPVLCYLLASVLLYWLMLIFASTVHSKLWTWAGLLLAVGNRDRMPERTVVMSRADRAAKNMTENLVIFTAVVVAAILAGAPREQTLLGGQIFFFARLIYWPLYLAGVSWIRTLSWAIALGGVALISLGAFQVKILG